jgi:hypothetical protein
VLSTSVEEEGAAASAPASASSSCRETIDLLPAK